MAAFVVILRLGMIVADEPFWVVASDVATVTELPPYVGLLSQAGLVLWSLAIGVAILAWLVLRMDTAGPATFFRDATMLTGAFLIDDALLVHDVVAPDIGIPETVVLGALGIGALSWAFRHRIHIARSATGPLLVAVALGVVSVAADLLQLPDWRLPDHNLFEDVPSSWPSAAG